MYECVVLYGALDGLRFPILRKTVGWWWGMGAFMGLGVSLGMRLYHDCGTGASGGELRGED